MTTKQKAPLLCPPASMFVYLTVCLLLIRYVSNKITKSVMYNVIRSASLFTWTPTKLKTFKSYVSSTFLQRIYLSDCVEDCK